MFKLALVSLLVSGVAVAGPAPEVAKLADLMGGAWSCEGNAFLPGGKALKLTGKMKIALDLEGMWLHESMDGKVGPINLQFESYLTFDAAQKKWRRIEIDSRGNHEISYADPAKDGKVEWLADKTGPDGKVSQSRTHFDGSDPKKLHLVGESTADKKTWTKTVELTCSK
jgi:hypothetical protein